VYVPLRRAASAHRVASRAMRARTSASPELMSSC
jgi:hypothetical protein